MGREISTKQINIGGKSYKFVIAEKLCDARDKNVYVGAFVEDVNADVKAETLYCVKEISYNYDVIYNESGSNCPGIRQFFDLFDIKHNNGEAEHLKRILARSDEAEKFVRDVENNRKLPRADYKNLYIIEPFYKPFFASCGNLFEAFDLMSQIPDALNELFSSKICGYEIDAFRDLKFSNVMVREDCDENGEINKTVILIDFASLHIKEGFSQLLNFDGAGTATSLIAMSINDVVPECFVKKIKGEYNKWDVFSFAGMICELFSEFNPLTKFSSRILGNGVADANQWKKLGEEFEKFGGTYSQEPFEHFKDFYTNGFPGGYLSSCSRAVEELEKLLRKMFSYNPQRRPSFQEVKDSLVEIKGCLDRNYGGEDACFVVVDHIIDDTVDENEYKKCCYDIIDSLKTENKILYIIFDEHRCISYGDFKNIFAKARLSRVDLGNYEYSRGYEVRQMFLKFSSIKIITTRDYKKFGVFNNFAKTLYSGDAPIILDVCIIRDGKYDYINTDEWIVYGEFIKEYQGYSCVISDVYEIQKNKYNNSNKVFFIDADGIMKELG